jgi:hypothetical protein
MPFLEFDASNGSARPNNAILPTLELVRRSRLGEIFRIATQISTPLALAGFLAAAFFLIVRLILKKNIEAQIRPSEAALIVRQIIDRLFVLSLVAMVFGFAGWMLIAVQKARASTAPNLPSGPDSPIARKPEPTLHDADESGIRYNVTWSVDANCTGWQKSVAGNPKLADGHSCDFTRTQVKIGESRDLFDHWNIALQAPGEVYEVDCQKNGFQLFEDATNGVNNNNHHKGVPEGRWGRCTGYINGGDDPVTVTAYYRVLR